MRCFLIGGKDIYVGTSSFFMEQQSTGGRSPDLMLYRLSLVLLWGALVPLVIFLVLSETVFFQVHTQTTYVNTTTSSTKLTSTYIWFQHNLGLFLVLLYALIFGSTAMSITGRLLRRRVIFNYIGKPRDMVTRLDYLGAVSEIKEFRTRKNNDDERLK